MSDQIQIEQAGGLLFDDVYVPAFLKQCAARQVSFSNEAELATALQNVLLIKSAEAEQVQNSNNSLHKNANVALRHMFGEDVAKTERLAQNEAQLAKIAGDVNPSAEVGNAASLLSKLVAAT